MTKDIIIDTEEKSKPRTRSNSVFRQEKSVKGNKNYTYHEYIEQKKPRNHKCRESWPAVLNKLGEHCINLG